MEIELCFREITTKDGRNILRKFWSEWVRGGGEWDWYWRDHARDEDQCEIAETKKSMKDGKAAGMDGIHIKILKDGLEHIGKDRTSFKYMKKN